MEPVGWASMAIGILTGVTALIVALRRERREDRTQKEKGRAEGRRSAIEQYSALADRWQKMHEDCQHEKLLLIQRLDHMDIEMGKLKGALGWPVDPVPPAPDEFAQRTKSHNAHLLKEETDALKESGGAEGGSL